MKTIAVARVRMKPKIAIDKAPKASKLLQSRYWMGIWSQAIANGNQRMLVRYLISFLCSPSLSLSLSLSISHSLLIAMLPIGAIDQLTCFILVRPPAFFASLTLVFVK